MVNLLYLVILENFLQLSGGTLGIDIENRFIQFSIIGGARSSNWLEFWEWKINKISQSNISIFFVIWYPLALIMFKHWEWLIEIQTHVGIRVFIMQVHIEVHQSLRRHKYFGNFYNYIYNWLNKNIQIKGVLGSKCLNKGYRGVYRGLNASIRGK